MQRYFFEIVESGRRHTDLNGLLLANDDAARDYARRIVQELAESYTHEANDWVVEIVADQRIIARIRFDGLPVH